MRYALLALVAACSGSHAHPSDGARDAIADASFTFAGHATARALANDASHMPVVSEGPFHSLAITAHLGDGTSVAVPAAADGSFTVATPAPISRLEVATDAAAPTDYELPAATLDLAQRIGNRYDRVLPKPGTSLSFTIASPPAGNVRLVSTGVWAQTAKLASASTTFSFDWSAQPGLLDASANDRLYYTVETTTGTSPQYLALSSLCSADVTMAQGSATPVTCTPAAVTQDQCTHVVAHVVDEYTRVAAAASAVFTGVQWDWTIAALPAESFGAISPIEVAHANATTAPAGDVDAPIQYAQPFPGHTAAVSMTVGVTRSYALTGLQPITLRTGTTHWVKPAADCTTAAELTGTVALATAPAIDGVALDSDNLTLAFDAAHPHMLAWQIASGSATHWIVRVQHLLDNAGTTDSEVVHTYITTATTIALDPAIFTAGQHYAIEIGGAEFYPNAAAGDLRTIGYPAMPYATSTMSTGVFAVDPE